MKNFATAIQCIKSPRWAKTTIVCVSLLSLTSCATFTLPDATGEILEFTVTPSKICVNRDKTVRISFKARSSNQQCVLIFLNDLEILEPSQDGPIDGPFNRCGTGEWGETYTFSLSRVFGDNIPPNVKVRIDLPLPAETGHLAPQGKLLDSKETQITTEVCP